MIRVIYALLILSTCLVSAMGQGLEMGSRPKKIIILLGPPGSGKGTQAQRISQTLSIPHISTGDLFRENISDNTALGKRAKKYMEAGQLVPDAVVLEMLLQRISQPDAKNGYLLDGFPRTILQAQAFDKSLCGDEKVAVINLSVAPQVIAERAAARLTCPSCACVYNLNLKPPVTSGQCDQCGAQLVRRLDDAPEVVQERLRVYRNQTEPLIDYYTQKGLIFSINGENPPDQVYQEVMQKISSGD